MREVRPDSAAGGGREERLDAASDRSRWWRKGRETRRYAAMRREISGRRYPRE